MAKRMLIDATHLEETRVVVQSGNRLEEFDFETTSKKQLKGNIYLAKITRVEPSLQAAFVDYGGNRHGFLPFSEIHPDYYRIPIADREALLAAEAEAAGDSADAQEDTEESDSDADDGPDPQIDDESSEPSVEAAADEETGPGAITADKGLDAETARRDGDSGEAEDATELDSADAGHEDQNGAGDALSAAENGAHEEVPVETKVDTVGGDDVEDAARRRAKLLRRYKIQEVIKRRQVILVQVTKEERGNKGAALTTYLSLAGRYCVLMPNTAKGGGISRKIANTKDRRRLKGILEDLHIPDGIAVIVRTAGSERTKAEIRRDYEFLVRLWDEIRSTTLRSTAPALIYEEANLIKRAIRDQYQSDTDEILVEGEDGYKAAKAFMKSLTPSHARKVKLYKENTAPLFNRYQIESQIDAMHNPVVQLRSGGYIVLHMTEALVAIDVNSGKATRERHIEETAYRTNLEAAEEVARQLRLRDMAGLIVIDFIDMDETRHNRAVERRLKDAMKIDRARIQLGRISPFGLLELSRQRLRPSLLESSTEPCPYCSASGFVRTKQSVALHILRGLEEEGIRRGGGEISISAPRDAALHLLNQMRDRLVGIEQRYGLRISIASNEDLIPPNYTLQRGSSAPVLASTETATAAERRRPEADTEDEDRSADRGDRKRGRGRRRRRKTPGGAAVEAAETVEAVDGADAPEAPAPSDSEAEEQTTEERAAAPDGGGDDAEDRPRRRRRGKRGGRRRSRRQGEENGTAQADSAESQDDTERDAGDEAAEPVAADAGDSPPAENGAAKTGRPKAAKPAGARRRRSRSRKSDVGDPAKPENGSGNGAQKTEVPVAALDAPGTGTGGGAAAESAASEIARPQVPAPEAPVAAEADAGVPGDGETEPPAEAEPKRRGWWNRWT